MKFKEEVTMAKKRPHLPSSNPDSNHPRVMSQGGMCNSVHFTEQVTNEEFKLPEVPDIAEASIEGRKRNGMTKSELAKATGIDLTKISRIETRKTRKPSRDVVCALSPYTGISATRLLMYTGYSDVYEEDIYYSKSGSVVDHEKIVADIYKADPDFLEALEDVSELPLSDIEIMKQLIFLLKYANKNCVKNRSGEEALKVFSITKKFLSEQLPALLEAIREQTESHL